MLLGSPPDMVRWPPLRGAERTGLHNIAHAQIIIPQNPWLCNKKYAMALVWLKKEASKWMKKWKIFSKT
jgi:hypothetical protein